MKITTPESVGIPSAAVSAFLQDLHDSRFNMHSVLILRNGQLVTEAYQEPYNRDKKHRMFSISKSFTALAAGLLIDEGRLSLDDKVVSFFPEYTSGPVHPFLASATIYDMLTMQDPHDHTTHGHGIKANWLESWFLTPPDHPPGTVFQYNTTSTNLVASIVERVTGMKMMDYMYPRLLTPLGFSEGCYCGETPDGDSFGGSAVMCTPMDTAKLAQLLMNDGQWEGKQLISTDYAKSMRSKLAGSDVMGIPVEGMFGYGYFTWHLRHGGFAFFGIHGQSAVGFPDKGLLVVTTGNTTDNYNVETDILLSQFMDRVYRHLYPALSDSPLPGEPVPQITALPHMLAPGTPTSPKASEISGKTYKLHPNKSGWLQARFEFTGDMGKLIYTNRRGNKEIIFGMGHAVPFLFPEAPNPRAGTPGEQFDIYTSGGWADERSLIIHVYDIASGFMQLQAVFDGNSVTMAIRPTDGYRGDYGGYMYGEN